MNFTFDAKLWLYSGKSAWVFITLPTDISEDIKQLASGLQRRGFGSVKVSVKVNGVKWKTSIFPDSRTGAYILPIKKDIRTKTKIDVGDKCEFTVQIDDLE